MSVSDIKRINKLSSTEIWYKKDLIIPLKQLPEGFKGPDETTVTVARERDKLAALKLEATGKMGFRSDLFFRDVLEACRTVDYATASGTCEWIENVGATWGITPREALAYFKLHDGNRTKAEAALEADIAWEKEQKGIKTDHRTRSSRRSQYVPLQNQEIEMKKQK